MAHLIDVPILITLLSISVDLRVFSFSIIVSLDYLMKIKEFFDVSGGSNQNANQVSQKGIVESTQRKKTSQSAPTAISMLTINLHIEKPDIILLEDMDDINSHCIVLNVRNSYIVICKSKEVRLI